MKLLFAALVAVLLPLQAQSTPLVFGRQAATIRPTDIEAIARAVAPYGGTPWLLTDFRSTGGGINGERKWVVRAHLAPSTATSELRRGPVVDLMTDLAAQNSPDPRSWKVNDPSRILTWAQVALPERSFDDVKSESDENLPLAIRGQITDADLLSSVRFLRTRPSLPKRDGLIVPSVPGPVRRILAPAVLNPMLPAVRLSIDGGPGCSWSVLLQRPDGGWFVESVEHGGCN